jgi:CRISPR-associated protein Csb2
VKKFSLAIEYLTGYAVATIPFARDQPEWPPHPARVYMALAAAHFESSDETVDRVAERAMLDWLSTLRPPAMSVPQAAARDVLTVYVPVNDQKSYEAIDKRSRQPRFFPRVHVGDQQLCLIYEADERDLGTHLEALEALCARVTRIGHSSSLVWVRLVTNEEAMPTHVPDEYAVATPVRIVGEGAMNRLETAFNGLAVSRYAELQDEINLSKGAKKKKLNEAAAAEFPNGQPTSQRPSFSQSSPYRELSSIERTAPTSSVFDPNFIVLRTDDASTQIYGIESIAAFSKALIGLLLSRIEASGNQIPSWISGHETNGEPLRSSAHIAIVPLAYVGRHWIDVERHARGQLMGLGILVPREVPLRERSKFLSRILFDERGVPRSLKLTLGRTGEWSVARDTSVTPKFTLRTSTYTESCRSWASVSPVVLDRMPKADRVKDPIGWRSEVAEVIASSCQNAGLPEPTFIRTEKTPFFMGSQRAMPGQGGFPLLRKGRFQVHVQLDFAQPVTGPVLIGAGRFRGYGLMRPWLEANQ